MTTEEFWQQVGEDLRQQVIDRHEQRVREMLIEGMRDLEKGKMVGVFNYPSIAPDAFTEVIEIDLATGEVSISRRDISKAKNVSKL
jgi:hypothetical protein